MSVRTEDSGHAPTVTQGLNNRTKVVFTLEIDGKGRYWPSTASPMVLRQRRQRICTTGTGFY
jgi:hypothetical protein